MIGAISEKAARCIAENASRASKPRYSLTPENHMMAAMMLQACWDLHRFSRQIWAHRHRRNPRPGCRLAIFMDAALWVFSDRDNRDWSGTFQSVCAILNREPNDVRRKILAGMDNDSRGAILPYIRDPEIQAYAKWLGVSEDIAERRV